MKIFVASDHAGFGLKEKLVPFLASLGHEVVDKGAHEFKEEDDYPDYVVNVAKEIAANPDSSQARGILLGGSGQGEAMCANRFRHVRAMEYYGPGFCVVDEDDSIVKTSREHNDSNVLSIGARFLSEEDMKTTVVEWLETAFNGEERHRRRIGKLDALENG